MAVGDITLQFKCTKTQHSMIGLSKGNDHNSYTDIDCAMYCDQGYLRGYQRGAHKPFSPVPTYTASDTLAVERTGTLVSYYKNGKKLQTCGYSLVGNIIADLSIHNTGKGGILSAGWIGPVLDAEVVNWKGQTCVTTGADGSIVKNGCGNGWNAAAYSTNLAAGDVTLQFRCTKAQHTMIGLSIGGNDHNSYTDIDCAMYCDQGTLRVYELGAHKWNGPAYTDTNILAVRRTGTKVDFLKNGAVIRTCTRTLSGDAIADLSIHNAGAGGVISAVWVGRLKPPPYGAVVWQAQGCTKSSAEGKIEKNGCGNGWNGGAFSTKIAPGDVSLHVKCTKKQHTMIGLAVGNSHNSYSDIDCALYCDQGNLRSYENGAHKPFSPVPTYEETDELTIERTGCTVVYKKGAKTIGKCSKCLKGNVVADLSIHNGNAGGILRAVWVGPVVVAQKVVWKGMACLVASGEDGKILKSGCGNGWNGGAFSTKVAPKDITVQFRCTKAQHTMLGLASGNSHNSYTDIDCALYCDQGVLRVYELGAYKWAGPAYTDMDVLGVRRTGARVDYLNNGKVIRTCARQLTGTVIADLSIHNAGKGGILSSVWIGTVQAPPELLWSGRTPRAPRRVKTGS